MAARPTIRDVARLAGVSVATVSRTLQGNESVNPAIAQRVRSAAVQLSYQPNALARGLRTNATATIGMVVPAISNPYYAALVEAVVRTLQSKHRQVLLSDSLEDSRSEADRVQALLARRVDGLIIIPCDRQRSAETVAAAAAAVPTVQLDRVVDGILTDYVICDDDAGIMQVIDYLGRPLPPETHFISAKPSSSTGQRRLQAFRAAVNGVVPREQEHLGDFTIKWGHKAVADILATSPPPAVIVCGADVVALGVLQELRDRGLQVPSDVAVTGYDDIPFATMTNPPLTTVHQPLEELAAASVNRLERRLQDPAKPTRGILVNPELRVRGSTTGRSLAAADLVRGGDGGGVPGGEDRPQDRLPVAGGEWRAATGPAGCGLQHAPA